MECFDRSSVHLQPPSLFVRVLKAGDILIYTILRLDVDSLQSRFRVLLPGRICGRIPNILELDPKPLGIVKHRAVRIGHACKGVDLGHFTSNPVLLPHHFRGSLQVARLASVLVPERRLCLLQA